jgi:hypothetical protein
MKKGTIKVKFSNGFGNNLFQYCFGRLLAEHHNLNYSHPCIPEMAIKEEKYSFNKNLKTIKFKAKSNLEAKKYDKDHQRWFDSKYKKCNFDFNNFMFYFEDYTLYRSHLEKIKTWFPVVEKTNTKDLVLHFRLKNRLVWETHYKNFVKPQVYKEVISSNFKFNNLYIVTDAKKWGHVDKKDIRKIQDEVEIKYRKNPTNFIPVKDSVNFMNNLVDSLKEFSPILHSGKNFIDDFNFMRSFDKILFKNSTFSWWASALSDASQVGVFGPWKPGKGKGKIRNLGKTDFKGWFSWGTEKDLLLDLMENEI